MTTSWGSPTQYPDDPTVNVTELVLLWLRYAALEALAITGRLPVRPVVLTALEDYLLYLPAVPMTTVLQSTLKRMPSYTAIGRTLSTLRYTSLGNLATHVRSLSWQRESQQ